MLSILQAEGPEHIAIARQLIEEYAAWLEFKLCFQGFDDEMQSMPGKPAGVIALRQLEEAGLCEMKRLYVINTVKCPVESARRVGSKTLCAALKAFQNKKYLPWQSR